jgi:DUF1365 family protein
MTPSCYDVHVMHRRRDPLDHTVRHRMTIWLVDLDDLPRLAGWRHRLCRFDLADHIDVRSLLNVKPARVLMLAQPRVYGYVFNPLTVFYLLNNHDVPTHVVAEVHNAHGDRHSYVMRADELRAEKTFLVSPFYPVDGEYTMFFPLPHDRLRLAVTLHREGERSFVATMTGVRRPGARLEDALRRPLETRAVMADIRRHGISLFLRGLRPLRGGT